MNKRETLITEALGDGEGAAFAAQAAALARRRRAVKQAGVAGGLMVASVAAIFLTNRQMPLTVSPVASATPNVEIMTDQELVAQLKDQPVLYLKDHDRITGVVFLDTKKKL